MIKSIRINGYSGLGNVSVDFTSPLTVLAGRNNVGKRGFLKALMFLVYSVCNEGDYSEETLETNGNTGDNASNKPISYELAVKSLSRFVEKNGANKARNIENPLTLRILVKSDFSAYSEVIDQSEHLENFDTQFFLENELAFWRFYRFNPTILQKESLWLESSSLNLRLGRDGSGLPSFLAFIRSQDTLRFKLLEEALNFIMPEYKGIELEVKDNLCFLNLKDTQGREIPAKDLSHGTLRTLALIAVVYASNTPGLVCIEEPDAGLHPDYLPFVVEMLRTATHRKSVSGTQPQVLITSYSPHLINHLKPEELMIVERKDDQTTFTSSETIINQSNALKSQLENGEQTLGELWAQGSLKARKRAESKISA